MTRELEFEPSSFAGEIDDDEVEAMWDHLVSDGSIEDAPVPEFDPSYRSFLERYHGGIPLNCRCRDLVILKFLNFANPFYKGNSEAIKESNVNVVRRWLQDRLPDNAIPFATLPHGNYLCFLYDGNTRPRIVRWYHELSEPGKPHLTPIAADFDEFLGLLTCSDP